MFNFSGLSVFQTTYSLLFTKGVQVASTIYVMQIDTIGENIKERNMHQTGRSIVIKRASSFSGGLPRDKGSWCRVAVQLAVYQLCVTSVVHLASRAWISHKTQDTSLGNASGKCEYEEDTTDNTRTGVHLYAPGWELRTESQQPATCILFCSLQRKV